MKHLRFDMLWASYNNKEHGHPQEVMKELGITYQHATPQSIADQWWFWNCENLPKELPPFLKVAGWNPMECIGMGLSQETAKKIHDYKPKSDTSVVICMLQSLKRYDTTAASGHEGSGDTWTELDEEPAGELVKWKDIEKLIEELKIG